MGGGILVGINWNHWFGEKDASATADLDENAEDYTGDREVYQGEKNTDTIDIPGFEAGRAYLYLRYCNHERADTSDERR